MTSPALGTIVLAHIAAVCFLELYIAPDRNASLPEAPSAPGMPLAPGPTPSTAIPNWRSEARMAAIETMRLETEGNLRLSFSKESSDRTPPERGGVFGTEAVNHRSGILEGGQIFWVTDDCYFDFSGAAWESRGEAVHLLTRACKPPPTGGGPTMFKSLTPDYMKDAPQHRKDVSTGLAHEGAP